MDLLQSMYSGSLPEGVPQSLDRTLRVLVLADKFEVKEALHSCTSSLSTLVSSLSPPDAFRILELPLSVRRLHRSPRFWSQPSTASAPSFPPCCATCSTQEASWTFPSQDLPLSWKQSTWKWTRRTVWSEAAMAWARHRHSEGPSQARELCHLVLPRVHLPSLSPA